MYRLYILVFGFVLLAANVLNRTSTLSVTCTGSPSFCMMSNGDVTVNAVFGSTGEIMYDWSKTGDPSFSASTSSITDLLPGEYVVRVTDEVGNEGFCSYTVINDPDIPCCMPEVICPNIPDYSPCGTLTIMDVYEDIERSIFNSINGASFANCGSFISFDISGGVVDNCGGSIGDIEVVMLANGIRVDSCITTGSKVLPPIPLEPYSPVDEILFSCDYVTQAAIDVAFDEWVLVQGDSIINSVVGQGCNPTLIRDEGDAPILCEENSVSITWSLMDDCAPTMELTASFFIDQPNELSPILPRDTVVEACDFIDQSAVNAAFENWLSTQSNNLSMSLMGSGCNPILEVETGEAPLICEWDSTTIVWTLSDQCFLPREFEASFIVNSTNDVNPVSPRDTIVEACDFMDQASIDTFYQNWLDLNYSRIFQSFGDDGCDPAIFVSESVIPDQCVGGSVTVTWTVTDKCHHPIFLPASLTVLPPSVFSPEEPVDSLAYSCDYEDQSSLDVAFELWRSNQERSIISSLLEEGCDPQITGGQAIAPLLCDGGAVTAVWTVSNQCSGPADISGTFSLTAPLVISSNTPRDTTSVSCSYISQTEVDAAYDDWFVEQHEIIEASIIGEGCDPEISVSMSAPPDILIGGSSVVLWSITDLCALPTVLQASFTIHPPSPFAPLSVVDTLVNACDIRDQVQLNSLYAAWRSNQTSVITANMEDVACNPSVEYSNEEVVMLCEGGETEVLWQVTDTHLDTVMTIGRFMVVAPENLSPYMPIDTITNSCSYSSQLELDSIFSEWVSSQRLLIMSSILDDGCEPRLSEVIGAVPSYIGGGSTLVTWSITDLCTDEFDLMARFVIDPPVLISAEEPRDTVVHACEVGTHSDLRLIYNRWLSQQLNTITASVTGEGCNSTVETSIEEVVLCEGDTTIITWLVSDSHLSGDELIGRFVILQPQDIDPITPQNSTSSSCNYSSQQDADDAFASWLDQQQQLITTSIINEGCDPQISVSSATAPAYDHGGITTVHWTLSDLCISDTTVEAQFEIIPFNDISPEMPNDTIVFSCGLMDQIAVEMLFAEWMEMQNARINMSIDQEGCNPQLDLIYDDSPELCLGGESRVSWVVSDIHYGPDTLEALFTLTEPNTLSIGAIQDTIVTPCDIVDQESLDSLFASWLERQEAIIEEDIIDSGCTPLISGGNGTSPLLTEGGNTVATWFIEDLCDTIQRSATFIVAIPDTISFPDLIDTFLMACSIEDQDDLLGRFNSWISTQTQSLLNHLDGMGCEPLVEIKGHKFPDFCSEGAITVVWQVVDLFVDTTDISATFELLPSPQMVCNSPAEVVLPFCSAPDGFALWINEFSVSGGCSPSISYDVIVDSDTTFTISDLSAIEEPALCGSVIEIIQRAVDDCQIESCSSTFTISNTPQISVNCPDNLVIKTLLPQDSIDVLYNNWINGFEFKSGICGHLIESLTDEVLSFTGGTSTMIYDVADNCSSDECFSEFIVDVPPVVLSIFGEEEVCSGQEQYVYSVNDNLMNLPIEWAYTGEGAIISEISPTEVELAFMLNATEGYLVASLLENQELFKDSIMITFASPLVCDEFCRGVLHVSSFDVNDSSRGQIQEYWAELLLTSNASIRGNLQISFRAGESIILQPGFEVSQATQFQALIDFCNDLGLMEDQNQ